jgi:2-hydroxy-6-oxonona-2,4-dienedioate hydrolase
MLGHGFTDAVSWGEAAPHPVLVDHVLAFADALGLTRFSIVGSSFGAQIATLVYLQAPERVTDLVIVGSGSSFNTEEEQAETLARVYENAMKALSDPTWESCRQRLANICYDQASVPDEVILSQLTSYARPGAADAYKATIEGMTDLSRARPYRILERLEEIVVRTLIIWGRQDTRGRLDRALAASRRIPACEMAVFEECGHLPYVEHPQKFNAIIGAFLDGRHPS